MHAVYEPYHISLSGTVPLLLSICENCLKNGIDCRGKQARFTLNEKVGYKQYTCVTLDCSKLFHLSEYLRGVPWVQDGRYIQKENGLTVLN